MPNIFSTADILLPKKRFGEDAGKFSVIACDQFTSEKAFWEECAKKIGDAASSLTMILPEAYLQDSDERIEKINTAMNDYCENDSELFFDSMIYVRRTQPDGRIRCGIVGKIDLEFYDYSEDSSSLVRPTEKTVVERIPPRVKIRENATLELPHIMLLIDDANKRVIEPLEEIYTSFEKAYAFDLIMGAGHIEGYFIDKKNIRRIYALLARYSTKAYSEKYYGINNVKPLLFAVGDGNHSLATAKAIYKNAKELYGKEAKRMPCRYALVELVNLYSEALDFEPIYRTVNCKSAEVLSELTDYVKEKARSSCGGEKDFDIELISAIGNETVNVAFPDKSLPVGFVQEILDEFVISHPECEIDYIHGEDSLRSLSNGTTLGILFGGMSKNDLFRGVISDGVLPRKTFSMGHALDKRHYLEARKIK